MLWNRRREDHCSRHFSFRNIVWPTIWKPPNISHIIQERRIFQGDQAKHAIQDIEDIPILALTIFEVKIQDALPLIFYPHQLPVGPSRSTMPDAKATGLERDLLV